MANNAHPPAVPTQKSGNIRFDFNNGVRILLPTGHWSIDIQDDASGLSLYRGESHGGWVTSPWKFFISYAVTVVDLSSNLPVLETVLDLCGQDVVIAISPDAGLGDSIAWIPIINEFRKQHDCNVICSVASDYLRQLFCAHYPAISFITPTQADCHNAYAAYPLGLFDENMQAYHAIDYRHIGLQQIGAHILGMHTPEICPNLAQDSPRIIQEKYVCIAVQASARLKLWLSPSGWDNVVAHLRKAGYRVLCIDKQHTVKYGDFENCMPQGAEDWTGDHPLTERASLLRHADFFIGVGSGLAWLAWACRASVILISGFSKPNTEFFTPWRLFDPLYCNGCWNEFGIGLNKFNGTCPRDKQYVCSTSITPKRVLLTIDALIAQKFLKP